MIGSFEDSDILRTAIAGIPRVAGVIAAIPVAQRWRACEAAERGYLQTMQEAGLDEAAAQTLVDSVMRQLRDQVTLLQIIDGETKRTVNG